MLSIFKENNMPMSGEDIQKCAHRILESYLNKGQIPEWDQFIQELPLLNYPEELREVEDKFLRLTKWSFMEDILKLPSTEYFFHSIEKSQRLTLSGEKLPLEVSLSPDEWQTWLEIISIKFKQNWNVQSPFCSFYGELFGKHYRFSLIHGSTSPENQSKLILRNLSHTPHPISSFGGSDVLVDLARNKKNVLIAGSTGSGKTSLISSLLDYVNKEEHVVILEDTFEIISELPHQTRFLAGNSLQTSLKSYLTYTLRLSPDRIILGEIRSHEVVPFLMAMNTGHRGLMASIHASSAYDALHRSALLFTLFANEANLAFEKVMELICRNLEYVVFMENKKVKEIIRILGSDKGAAFYETIQSEGEIKKPLF